jgi:hypothetical protein
MNQQQTWEEQGNLAHPTPTPQLPWTTFKHNLVQGIHIPSRWVKFYEAY